MLPLGSLLVGGLSQHIGAPAVVLGEGGISIVLALAFIKFLTKRVKPEPLLHPQTASGVGEPGN
jgi:hypothetical protein